MRKIINLVLLICALAAVAGAVGNEHEYAKLKRRRSITGIGRLKR
jgi:hypothetical protein